jgi:citrate lyase subunit beta/citryl-CoA lyase
VIERAYLPTAEEVDRARAIVARAGEGASALAGGEFVDAPVVRLAAETIALAERYG